MSARSYLPSAQFMVIVAALALSGGVVVAAQYFTTSHGTPASLSTTETANPNQAWEDSLAEIQAQSGTSLPKVPVDAVQSLIEQSQGSNLTDSVGRGILARLTTAGMQGLGDDAPTQDSIIAAAAQQINASGSSVPAPAITTTDSSTDTLRDYGNEVITILGQHTTANSNSTLKTLAEATDTRSSTLLGPLAAIGADYKALARDLASVPVPSTLAPLHRQVVANFTSIANTYPEMKYVVDDPVRGLAAMQRYQQLLSETGRLFGSLAEALKNGGILFSKDEPGAAWSLFLAAS